MKKILYISIIALALTLGSQRFSSLYTYVYSTGDCRQAYIVNHSSSGCYGTTDAKGFPLGYIPVEPDSAFDDYNPTFDTKNFFLNFLIYYTAINALFGIYKMIRKED